MSLLTTTEIKQHIETDLGDTALQRLLDASEQEINKVAGKLTDSVEVFEARGFVTGRDRSIWTNREIASITNIKERPDAEGAETTLSGNDYRQIGRRELIRLRDGDNPRLFWAAYATVTYATFDDTDMRKTAQIDLVNLMISSKGIKSETAGDYSVTYFGPEYEMQKNRILKRLQRGKILA